MKKFLCVLIAIMFFLTSSMAVVNLSSSYDAPAIDNESNSMKEDWLFEAPFDMDLPVSEANRTPAGVWSYDVTVPYVDGSTNQYWVRFLQYDDLNNISYDQEFEGRLVDLEDNTIPLTINTSEFIDGWVMIHIYAHILPAWMHGASWYYDRWFYLDNYQKFQGSSLIATVGYAELNATAGTWQDNTAVNPDAGSFIGDGNYSDTYDDDTDYLYNGGPDCEAFYQYLNFSYSTTTYSGYSLDTLSMICQFQYEDNTGTPFSNATLEAYNFETLSWDYLEGSIVSTFPGLQTDYSLEGDFTSDHAESGLVMVRYHVTYMNGAVKGKFDICVDETHITLIDEDAPLILRSTVNPPDPNTSNLITLSAVVSDNSDVVSVTFYIIAYPVGFDPADSYNATETSTNFWSYTFDVPLTLGYYLFLITATDGLNENGYTEYAYLDFWVRIYEPERGGVRDQYSEWAWSASFWGLLGTVGIMIYLATQGTKKGDL